MQFVARMNGCADPGLIRPAPGEHYQRAPRCRDETCRTARRMAACELEEKRRGLVSLPSSDGRATNCARRFDQALDLEEAMRSRICRRVSADPDGMCASGPRLPVAGRGSL